MSLKLLMSSSEQQKPDRTLHALEVKLEGMKYSQLLWDSNTRFVLKLRLRMTARLACPKSIIFSFATQQYSDEIIANAVTDAEGASGGAAGPLTA